MTPNYGRLVGRSVVISSSTSHAPIGGLVLSDNHRYVCYEQERNNGDGNHGQPDVPIELRPNDLVRLPGREDLDVGEGNLK